MLHRSFEKDIELSFSFSRVFCLCSFFEKASNKNERLRNTNDKRSYRVPILLKEIISHSFSSMHEDYTPYEIKLAYEIADTLKDRDSITMHLKYARKYKEEFLRKVLAKVMSIDESKIKRTRGALYTFLINQNATYGDGGH